MAANQHPAALSRNTADLIYDAFYSGGLGGSVVALFFLAIDAFQGRPLFTPSLIGSVLFGGAVAEGAVTVRLDMVAYFTLVHFAVFGAVGTLLSTLVHTVELHARHPGEVLLLAFLLIEGGFFIGALLFMPGVMAELGAFRIAMANFLAAGAMVLFFVKQHRADLWQRMKELLNLA